MMKNVNNSTEISLIVIRFEIDDININSKPLKSHKEELCEQQYRADTLNKKLSDDLSFLTYECKAFFLSFFLTKFIQK
jgi:hypothetical protein